MSNPVFPPSLARQQDAKYYEFDLEDVAMKTEMEGGYVVSRPKHTRKPRRTFTSGLTCILDADRAALEDFYELVKGGSVVFDWTDPIDAKVYQVRFAEKLKIKYTGVSTAHRWDVTFVMQQA